MRGMKSKTFLAALVGLSLSLFATVLQAQTNTPPTAGTFFDSVTGYFTSFNTNLDSTFDAKGNFWTGADSIQGGDVSLAHSVGISYRLYKLIDSEVVIRNSGIAGTLVSGEAGLSLNFKVHDAKLSLYGDGGYAFNSEETDRFYGEIGVRASKALTEHTFAGVGIGAQLPANRQVFQIFAGFTF